MNKDNKPYWPLCADTFTFWDKIKISKFLFTERIWTYGTWVRKYEETWEKFLKVNHVIMTSSGSTANELIALRRKWELQRDGQWPQKNKVIFPANTWVSSVTPWLQIGFEPVFVDVSKISLNVDSLILKKAFDENYNIGTVFYTALLGFFGDLEKCKDIAEENGAKFLMDNCEATFSRYFDSRISSREYLMNFVTSSSSLFYSHFSTTGTEGGFIATNSDEENEWFCMMRSHGLTRGMPEKYKNPNVNPDFDFALQGSNYRMSNLQAFMGLCDFDRAVKFSLNERYKIMFEFVSNLDYNKFNLFGSPHSAEDNEYSVPLAIPVICKTRAMRIKVETYLKFKNISFRPIIGGCLLEHTAFKQYGDSKDFPNAMISHEKGLYLGLHKKVTLKMARKIAQEISKL